MTTSTAYFVAFLVGLTGSVHCFGMCGGIVSALTFAIDPHHSKWPYLLAYNAGRIISYLIAGMLAGGVGIWATHLLSVQHAQQVLQVFAGCFMILLGLYLSGWWTILSRVEQAGGFVWRRIEPIGRRWFPVRTPLHAFGIGLVWGWLPCGLVYSVLIGAISAGGILQGGGLLLCFGVGTLPALLAMGTFAAALESTIHHPLTRRAMGLLVMLLGLYQIYISVR